MELFGTILYFYLISGIGMTVVKKIEIDPVYRLAASLLIGSIITGIFMFVLAAIKLVYPIYLVVFAISIFSITLLATKPLWLSVKDLGSFLFEYVVKNDGWSKPFLLAISLLAIWLIFLTWTPPRAADAMRSHLVQIEDVVQHHGFIFRPYFTYNVPMYFTLTFLPVYMAFKGIGLQFAVLIYFILSVIFLLRLAFHVQLKNPRLLVFMLCLIPISYHEAHQVYNDWVVIFYILIGFIFLMERSSKNAVLSFFLGFMSIGFAMGIKHQTVLVIPWFMLLGWHRLKITENRGRRLLYLLFGFITMCTLASPFYIRNLINIGNPVWPLLYKTFPANDPYLDHVAEKTINMFRGDHSFGTFIHSIKCIITYPLIPVTIWLLAFLGALLNKKSSRLHIGIGLFSYFLLLWIINPDFDHYLWRYSIWVLPIGVLAAALLYETVKMREIALLTVGYQIIVCITLIYGIGIGLLYSKGYFEYLIHRDLKEYHKATRYYSEYAWINENLPEDTKILVIVGAGQTYYLNRPYLRADSMSGLINWETLADVFALKRKIDQLNIDYVLYVRGNSHMHHLLDDLSSFLSTQIIFDKTTNIINSRILETYSTENIRLIKL